MEKIIYSGRFKTWFKKNWEKLCANDFLDAENHRLCQCKFVWQQVIEDDFNESVFNTWFEKISKTRKLEGTSLKQQCSIAWNAALESIKTLED